MKGRDWVTERSLCSSVEVFEKLRLEVKEDVQTRNRLLANPRDAFRVVDNGSMFSVIVPTSPLHRKVTFTVIEETISVRDGKGKPVCEATLTLNHNGECRVKINEQECELWQMRRIALEDVFFGS